MSIALGCAAETEVVLAESDSEDGPVGKGDVAGTDSRSELFEHPVDSLERAVARSVALMVVRQDLGSLPGGDYRYLQPHSLVSRFDVCPDVRFAPQPSAGYCTAFLVGPDIVATAGHCLVREGRSPHEVCAETSLAFDFGFETLYQWADAIAGTDESIYEFEAEDVFHCAEVLSHGYVQGQCGGDYAILRLDRAAGQRTPITVRSTLAMPGEDALVVAHPSGLPTKIDVEAVVAEGTHAGTMGVYADIMPGSSGGPVFDANGEALGIVTCSHGDWLEDEAHGCLRTVSCSGPGCSPSLFVPLQPGG